MKIQNLSKILFAFISLFMAFYFFYHLINPPGWGFLIISLLSLFSYQNPINNDNNKTRNGIS